MSDLLVRLFGWRATLFHGDPLVYDRWRWIRRRLRKTKNEERLLDVGCGSGAFTIGTAKRGYNSVGLSWDERNQGIGARRARISRATKAKFEICDVRKLADHQHLAEQFNVVLCTENIEHIIDDFALMDAMARCLKPGGRLLLTSPYIRRVPQSSMDFGPFPDFEDGRHVRCGYSRSMFVEMCDHAGLKVEEISFVSGPISQLGAWLLWKIGYIHPLIGWVVILPLRPLAPVLDPLLTKLFKFTPFCIGLEAHKARVPVSAAVAQRAAA